MHRYDPRRRLALITAFASSLALAAPVALAQTYPDKPVRLVIGYDPGTAPDVPGRLLASRLGELLKQQVIVDNRAGAGGQIAAQAVAKSPPDGHTLPLAEVADRGLDPAIAGDEAHRDAAARLVDLHVGGVRQTARVQLRRHRMARGFGPQARLVDLADGGHRHGLNDLDPSGHRRPLRDQRRGERHQFLGADELAGFQRHERDREFPCMGIGLAHRRGHHHARMPQQDGLDQARIDVVGAADDDVLRAPRDEDPALRIDVADVAADQPVVLEGAGVALGIRVPG